MAIFGSSRKKMAELEKDALANPEPAKLTTLIEMCVAANDRSKALEITKTAMTLFPAVESFRVAYRNVKKLDLQPRIIELQNAINGVPTSKHFEMLANIYLTDLEDADNAYEVVLKGLEKFPDGDGLHLIAGVVRMSRFHKDFLANDFHEAVAHFRKAVDANPMNYKSIASMGRLYSEVGQATEALEHFRKAREINATDEKVAAVVERLSGAASPSSTSLDDALQQVEFRRRLGPDGEAIVKIFEPTYVRQETMRIERPKAQQYLVDLKTVRGFKAAVIIDRAEAITAAADAGWNRIEDFAKVVAQLVPSSEDGSRRMDIGGIIHVAIDTPIGKICLTCNRSLMLGILLERDAREDEVAKIMERFRLSFP